MRDLKADKEICEKATPGPWYREKTGANFNGFSSECLIGTTSIYATGNNIYAEPKGGTSPSNDANFIAAAREGWPEAIERAIAAEDKIDALGQTIGVLDRMNESLLDENARLTEANDIQRASIQNLSAQVAAYRDALEVIAYTSSIPGQGGTELEHAMRWTEKANKAREALLELDPGAKYRAVVDAAKTDRHKCDNRCHSGCHCNHYRTCKHLADLEGGVPVDDKS